MKGHSVHYADFKSAIHGELRRTPAGLTWPQLRDRLRLPYDRPCPTWTRRLEREIKLQRIKGPGRALVWCIGKSPRASQPAR